MNNSAIQTGVIDLRKGFKNLAAVKAKNKAIGNYWFTKKTMSFFKSRIESGLIKGMYFITSEQIDERFERLYSVRKAMPDGEIQTIGGFQGYKTKEAAKAAITKLIHP